MSKYATSYEGYKDKLLNLFYDKYGVYRPKMLTEERIKVAFQNGISAEKYVAWMAEELKLIKL